MNTPGLSSVSSLPLPADESPKRYMITGGAGFLGINLIRYLLARGHAVRIARHGRAFDYADCRRRHRGHAGDIRDVAACATRDGRDVDDRRPLRDGPAALPPRGHPAPPTSTAPATCSQAADEAGCRRASCTSPRPRSTASPTTTRCCEDDRLDGVGPYGKAKVEAEGVCAGVPRARACACRSSAPRASSAPSASASSRCSTTGPPDGRGFPMIGNGRNRYQLLDVEDLCDAI